MNQPHNNRGVVWEDVEDVNMVSFLEPQVIGAGNLLCDNKAGCSTVKRKNEREGRERECVCVCVRACVCVCGGGGLVEKVETGTGDSVLCKQPTHV